MRDSREQLVLDEIDAANRALAKADRKRKYRKMSESPYNFFRGTNHLFWGDVWQDWRYYLFGGVQNTQTWLQGDAHVYNHGSYGDDSQGIHYGMDDFDDALVGDYQYDLWRHAASMVLDAEENVDLAPDEIRRAIRHLLSTYLDTLVQHQDGRPADDIHVHYMKEPLSHFMKKVMKKSGPQKYLAKWTVVDNGERRFNLDKKKMGRVSASEREQLVAALAEQYPGTLDGNGSTPPASHFKVKDIARRVDAGIGSLGLDRYYALIEGATDGPDDDIILDIKEQTPPPAYRFMRNRERRAWRKTFCNEGHRHFQAFHALADHPDEYLGWLSLGKKHFSVRERSPYKKDFPTHKIKNFKQYRRLTRQWGRILAREHIRGARTLHPDAHGTFCKAVLQRCEAHREDFKEMVVDLAFTYARCVKKDYAVFVAERCPADG
ncbi:hypothetical protein GCM10028792_36710 [Salinisphaera aquimarina]